MELSFISIFGLIAGALLCELIDSSLGMLYGTILSPVLIIAGFNPFWVVPSILLSQAVGGLTASVFHHRLKNADLSFKNKKPSDDLRVTLLITSLGILAAIAAALIAVNIPKIVLKSYIGILVVLMGIIVISKVNFKFSWKKIVGIGILSAINKAISGGGFGPIVTAGQIVSGRQSKNSIGATTLAEAPICIAAFLVYLFTQGISNWNFVLVLCLGAFGGAVLGPFFTARFKSNEKLKIILGILTLVLGLFVLANTWFLKINGASA